MGFTHKPKPENQSAKNPALDATATSTASAHLKGQSYSDGQSALPPPKKTTATSSVVIRKAKSEEESTAMAPKYVFVWDTETETFPERYRVVRDSDTTAPDDGDALNGTVADGDVDALYSQLRERYPSPRYELDGQYGTRWSAVERIFPAMRTVE